jgi:hypothetical protein
MTGYETVWNGTLEREAVRAQQRPVAPEAPKIRNKHARQRLVSALSSRRQHWWTVAEVWDVLQGDIDRTWLSSLLRELCWDGHTERESESVRGGGRVWRYRVKG